MNRGTISNFLRQIGLLYWVDHLRFYIQQYKHRALNRSFRKENPEVVLPPDYLIYESFHINYQKYYTESIETTKWLTGHLSRYIELKDKKLLDWGCGPGRIIRHLPAVVGHGCEYYGTDYNANTIAWCKQHLPGIQFNQNSLNAALPYANDFFDVIYGISIFTHLSAQLHRDWFNELYRILKPGGIMFLTTQGDNFIPKMTASEILRYQKGELVVRGNVKEGHRTYSAFQPAAFMMKLFQCCEVLEHIESKPQEGRETLPQDIWIIRK